MPRKRASPLDVSLIASKFKGTSESPFMNRLFTFYLLFSYLFVTCLFQPPSIPHHPPLSLTDMRYATMMASWTSLHLGR